jgi:Sec-independent protein secretion pathway component TatC
MEQRQIRRERALYLVRLLVFGWRLTAAQIVWTVRIAIVLGVLILVGLYTHRVAPTTQEQGPSLTPRVPGGTAHFTRRKRSMPPLGGYGGT